MSGSRRAAAALVVVVAAVLAGWSWMRLGDRRSTDAAPATAAAGAVPMGVGLAVIHPGADEPLIVAVNLFNHRARQAAATNAALDAAKLEGPRPSADAITFDLDPGAWASVVQFSGGNSMRPVDVSAVRVVRRPDHASQVLAGDTIRVLFEIAPEGVAVLGGRVMATVRIGTWTAESSVAALSPPSSPRDRLVLRAKAAQALGDMERMLSAGDALVAADASSPWGHWYRGLAFESRGDRAGALAAYEAAAARLPDVSRLPEPPVDLFRRIAALR